MVSISSETNGMVDHSQLIQVSSSCVYSALTLFLSGSCEVVSLCHSVGVLTWDLPYTPPSMDKYFSTQHRPFSTPALVQRSTDTSMPKSKAGSRGRSSILSCGGQDFISPIKELLRSVNQTDLSTECCMLFRVIRSNIKNRKLHTIANVLPISFCCMQSPFYYVIALYRFRTLIKCK